MNCQKITRKLVCVGMLTLPFVACMETSRPAEKSIIQWSPKYLTIGRDTVLRMDSPYGIGKDNSTTKNIAGVSNKSIADMATFNVLIPGGLYNAIFVSKDNSSISLESRLEGAMNRLAVNMNVKNLTFNSTDIIISDGIPAKMASGDFTALQKHAVFKYIVFEREGYIYMLNFINEIGDETAWHNIDGIIQSIRLAY